MIHFRKHISILICTTILHFSQFGYANNIESLSYVRASLKTYFNYSPQPSLLDVKREKLEFLEMPLKHNSLVKILYFNTDQAKYGYDTTIQTQTKIDLIADSLTQLSEASILCWLKIADS